PGEAEAPAASPGKGQVCEAALALRRARAVVSTPARSQVGKELIGAADRRDDLLVGDALLNGVHEAAQAGAVGRAPEETPEEAVNDAREALRAVENGQGDLAGRGAVRQGRANPRLADRIDAAVEGVLVEGGQEAV